MNVHDTRKWCVAGSLLALTFGVTTALFAQPSPTNVEQGVQVLTRGPVHEAFAETVTFDPEPGIVTPKAPPAAIEEVPPEQRPEGDNVTWIPGYWAWDDERNDFLWISGIWRALPPGRQWVPGYWGKSGQGFQWTSGYWADAESSEVEYLPEPPATVEAGPNIAAPSADQTWLPGCWIRQNNRYAWRPGFWSTAQPNWVWVPAHYAWAPRGYVFIDGYWDYPVGRRGVLFAPVYFPADTVSQRGFSYTPTTVIDLSVFATHLFMRPRYQHYYFGDYYAADYRDAGFLPWFSINTGRSGYDPIFAHDRWRHRQDREWERRQQAEFLNRRDREDLRPPHVWAGHAATRTREMRGKERSSIFAETLDDFRTRANSSLRFQPVNQSERRRFIDHAQKLQRFREERQRLELHAAGGPAESPGGSFVPGRVRFSGSPILAPPGGGPRGNQTPPRMRGVPTPDPNVAPQPRANRSPGQRQERTVNRMPLDPRGMGPQPQPKAEPARPRRGNGPTGPPPAKSKQDKQKDREKDNGKSKGKH